MIVRLTGLRAFALLLLVAAVAALVWPYPPAPAPTLSPTVVRAAQLDSQRLEAQQVAEVASAQADTAIEGARRARQGAASARARIPVARRAVVEAPTPSDSNVALVALVAVQDTAIAADTTALARDSIAIDASQDALSARSSEAVIATAVSATKDTVITQARADSAAGSSQGRHRGWKEGAAVAGGGLLLLLALLR